MAGTRVLNNLFNVTVNTDNVNQLVFNIPQNNSNYIYLNSNIVNLFRGCHNLTFNIQQLPFLYDKVTNMAYAYFGCQSLTGSPICGPLVTNMYQAYESCCNLTGSPICGPNVTSMHTAYSNCRNLTGNPACGPKVKNMGFAYANCINLTGNVNFNWSIDSSYEYDTFKGCFNNCTLPINIFVKNQRLFDAIRTQNNHLYSITTNDIIWTVDNANCFHNGNLYVYKVEDSYVLNSLYDVTLAIKKNGSTNKLVLNMPRNTGIIYLGQNISNLFNGCKNLNFNLQELPFSYKYVTNMSWAYYNCQNLTGSPICDNNINKLVGTYYNCQNLTGSPVCGTNVTNMSSAYGWCTNLTGSPVCGLIVTDLSDAYGSCHNLTGSPVCGDRVTNMWGTYFSCYNLTGQPVCGNNVFNLAYAYSDCHNLTGNPACGPMVTDIMGAYRNCSNLTGNITFTSIGTTTELGRYAFTDCFKGCPLRINVLVKNQQVFDLIKNVTNNYSIIGDPVTWTTDNSICFHNKNLYIYKIS